MRLESLSNFLLFMKIVLDFWVLMLYIMVVHLSTGVRRMEYSGYFLALIINKPGGGEWETPPNTLQSCRKYGHRLAISLDGGSHGFTL